MKADAVATEQPNAQAVATRASPFIGTRPFAAADGPYFFGRGAEATRLANLAASSTLCVLYGESGVGKTSLLNARLSEEMNREGGQWVVIDFREWQTPCLANLAAQAAKSLGQIVDPADFAETLLDASEDQGRPVLLVLDQFEEYFLYHPEGDPSFESELSKLANLERSPVRILLCLRSDGVFLLDRLRQEIPRVYRSMMAIEALDATAARAAILGPIRQYNNEHSDAPQRHVEEPDEALLEALIQGSDHAQILRRLQLGGRGAVEQPHARVRVVALFLQLALDALWQHDILDRSNGRRLMLEGLLVLAGMAGSDSNPNSAVARIAERRVDSVLRRFGPRERANLPDLFDCMITPSGSKIAVRIPEDVTRELGEARARLVLPMLEKLETSDYGRLVHRVGHAGVPQFEIMHDAWAAPLLVWTDGERKAQMRVRSNRRWSLIVAGLTAAAAVIIAGLFVLDTWKQAQIDRAVTFAETDQTSEFRLRMLVLLASIDWNHGLFGHFPNREPSLAELAKVRAIAPSLAVGGTASGLNRDGTQLLTFDAETGAVRAWYFSSGFTPAALPRLDLSASRNGGLANSGWPGATAGFIRADDKDMPVVYSQGILNYLVGQGDGAAHWVRFDLADLLDPADIPPPGAFLRAEVTAGDVMLQEFRPADQTWQVARLRGVPADPVKVVFVKERFPGAPVFPIMAYGLDGYLLVRPVPSQRGEVVDFRRLGNSAPAEQVWSYSASTGAGPPGTGLPQPLVGVADSLDALAVRDDAKLTLRRIGDGGKLNGPVIYDLSDGDARPFSTGSWAPPPLALVRHGAGWRIAWLRSDGIVLREALDSGGGLSRVADRWPVLLSGPLSGVPRLSFSRTEAGGRFLVLTEQTVGPKSHVQVLVWDLDTHYAPSDPAIDQTLHERICAVANLEKPDGNQLNPAELATWAPGEQRQPCPN
jgi:hypothetical protein